MINDNAVKASLRSAGKIDVAALAQTLVAVGMFSQLDADSKARLKKAWKKC